MMMSEIISAGCASSYQAESQRADYFVDLYATCGGFGFQVTISNFLDHYKSAMDIHLGRARIEKGGAPAADEGSDATLGESEVQILEHRAVFPQGVGKLHVSQLQRASPGRFHSRRTCTWPAQLSSWTALCM